ncbi:MAG: hypothetical protein QM504_15325 [Pseudomonadota bacterium]
MTQLNKKTKFSILLSVVWVLVVFVITINESQTMDYDNPLVNIIDTTEFLTIFILSNIPLIVAWGIWWIKKK